MNAGSGGAAPVGGNAPVGGGGVGQGGGGAGPVGGMPCKAVTPINGSGLTVSATNINAFRYAPSAGNEMVKMAYDPVGKDVVIISGNGSMVSFKPDVALPTTASTMPVTTTSPYNVGYTPENGFGGGFGGHRGIAFDAMGNLYVLAVRGGGSVGVSIKKGAVPATPGGMRSWTTVVTTGQGFPASGTDYDHSFSGIAISPDGMNLFISSGSRTEHGETRGALREAPLSSCILKFPTGSMSTVSNDEGALAPFLFADGTRNSFDLEFNAEGDLFGTENGPDMDLPDEVNFIEQGKHYGFPWRFGATDNPTIDPNYNRQGDKRLNPGFGGVMSYAGDASFPPKPNGVTFTDPIMNMGPDAISMRADRDADISKATAGLPGVTGHRSPLGLSFDKTGALCGEYYKAGFMLSYGALIPAALGDEGRDLLLLSLTKAGGAYTMTAKKIAKGINSPMDSVLVGNRLFAITFGDGAQIYVFELPTP
jgi:hypothetical protein